MSKKCRCQEKSDIMAVPRVPIYRKYTFRQVNTGLGSAGLKEVEVICEHADFREGWVHFKGCLYNSDWGMNLEDFTEYEVDDVDPV